MFIPARGAGIRTLTAKIKAGIVRRPDPRKAGNKYSCSDPEA